MSPSRDIAVGLALLLLTSPCPSGAQAPSPPATPTFRTGVDLVVVEVIAVDRSGNLAKGLTAEDFKVEISGDPREVASVDLVARETRMNTRAPEGKTDAGPDVSINTEAVTNRRVLIVVDQGSLGPDNNATLVAAARRWLQTLDPTDRVGLVALPPPGPVVEFTTNHQLVDDGLAKVRPIGGVPPAAFSVKNIGLWEAVRINERDTITRDLVIERECLPQDRLCPMEIDAAARDIAGDVESRLGSTLGPLRNMLRAMRVLPGPKHAVLLSAGWPLDPQALGSKLEPIAVAAANANVILHTIVTERASTEAYMRRISPTFVQDRNMLQTSVETLAGWTGGASHRVTNQADVAFQALNGVMAGYYRLGVRPQADDLDGKAHRISVKVSRPGVSIRSHRKVIVVSNEPSETQESDPEAALSAALVSAVPQTGLAVRATSYFLHEDESAPDRLRVLAAAEITGGAAGAATVRLGLFDEDGRLVTGIDRDVQIPARGPATVSAALHAPPGVYSLRIAARDGAGRVGTVQRDIELKWQDVGSIKTTGLALFQVGATANETPEPVVDSIARNERLIAQLAFSVTSHEAPEPSPVLEITAEGGSTPLLRQPIRVSRMEDGTRWLAQGTISMTLLPPGSYTVTALVAAGAPPLRRRIDVLPENEVSSAATGDAAAVAAGGSAAADAAAASTRQALASLAKPAPFQASRMLDSVRLGPVLAQLGNRPDAAAAREALQHVASGPWPTDPDKGPLSAAPVAGHFVAGLGQLQAGDLEAAAVQFRLAMRAAPDFGPAMAYLAACYAAGGKHKEAAGAWQAALVRARESPWLQQLAIEAWLRAERPATALALAKQARQRFPDEESFERLEVRAELADGRAREGLERLSSIRSPDASLMLMALATLYTAAKDGTPIWDRERDLAAMIRWRDAYAAAGGDSQALVNTWMTEMSPASSP